MRINALAISLVLLLAPAGAPAYAHHDDAAAHAAEAAGAAASEPAVDASPDAVTVEAGWSRATPPMANVGAGYLLIRNGGSAPVHLRDATSAAAERVEIHRIEMEGDVARMRPLPEGVEIPAGGTAALEPGGTHLMLIGLAAPLRAGDRVPVTLRFDDGTRAVELVVGPMGGPAPAAGHAGH